MNKMLLLKSLRVFLVMLLPGYSLLNAQTSYDIKHKVEFTHCGSSIDSRVYADMVDLDYFLDGKLINMSGAVYPAGKHDFRVVVRERNPREGFVRSFEIKEIRLMALHKEPIHDRRAEIHSMFGKDVKLALNIGQLGSEYRGYSIIVTIDRCDDGIPEPDAMVKVITTVSPELGGPATAVSDIYVQIGDQLVPIDEEGVGWLKIRPAQYKMTYYRVYRISIGSTRPGTVTLRSARLSNTQSLISTDRKNDASKLECNVPLLKESAGSGNLYDYELRINMIGESRAPNYDVHVVAVQPGVLVHKAGTPEDQWVNLEVNTVLQQGDEISCDPEGAATLQFADNYTTVVKNTSQLKIASYFTEGGVVKTEILLKMGEVASQVHKSEATKSDFRIKSPTLTSSRKGTIFSHRYDPVTKTDIIKVQEGMVDLIPANPSLPTISLKAGQQVQATANGVGNITPFIGKIDFSTKGTFVVTAVQGKWLVTQGAYSGRLTLYQSDDNLSGYVDWSNHQRGNIESGSIKDGNINFIVAYTNGLKGTYTATLDQSGKKMVNGTGVSNNGSSATWFASKE